MTHTSHPATAVLRAILATLILVNLFAIAYFSMQNGEKSEQTSGRVTHAVAQVVVKDFAKKPATEQKEIISRLHAPLRDLAHVTEYACLGAWILLLLLTWRGRLLGRYLLSLAATLSVAIGDEFHQSFVDARGAEVADVFLDLSGAILTCTAILLVAAWHRTQIKRKPIPMQITNYKIASADPSIRLRLAVASDLHNCPHGHIIDALKEYRPDRILIPGDLADDEGLADESCAAYDFLRACAAIAPTYYSLGNHELACYHKGNPWRHPIPKPLTNEIRSRIAKTGAILLENTCVHDGPLCICGLTSGIHGKKNQPSEEALAAFSKEEGYRILLCHHPEYFVPYVEKTGIELTVCGHAHGGQWRLGSLAAYAPGQGIFPKYTAGVINGRCVISRGLGNHTWIPRIFNHPELVIITVEPA